MAEKTVRAPFRIAIRAEGTFVNAYIADAETMRDAILVASMMRVPMEKDPALFEEWKALLVRMVALACEENGWGVAEFFEERAPEHERAGRA